MKFGYLIFLTGLWLLISFMNAGLKQPDVSTAINCSSELAKRLPIGWNSYNCFDGNVTEQEVKANANP